jgi:protoheme IX farnesyltransferase
MRPTPAASPGALSSARTRVVDVITLAKARVNALVVATTAGGYYMASQGPIDPGALAVTCLGTALVASGAAAYNQVTERETDRLMNRTRLRPVADGRMTPAEGRTVATALSATGLLMLWLGVNLPAAIVALATLLIYAAVYTPLKRRTSVSTIIGAVPGALPPLIGWAGAGASLADPAAWALFFLMFLWQLPHFLAIAWIYRDDYARAGLPMLPVIDRHGAVTGRQVMLWAATIVPFSELPFLLGLTTATYAVGALVLGIGQAAIALMFAIRRTDQNARRLFYASITYLPLLWLLMAFARR